MIAIVLVFGVALLLAVLTSAAASRSPLSTTTVFLLVGLVAGPLGVHVIDIDGETAEHAAEIALFAILFTDGQHASWPVLRRNWGPPTRALVVAMPVTLGIVALLAHTLAGLPWGPALVLGAVLAPTDPVFASALVGREDVPRTVRNLLNIESGLNDGLALPAVLILVGVAGGNPSSWSTDPGVLLSEVATGIGIGLLLPLAIDQLLRVPWVGAEENLQPLGPLAVALLLYGVCSVVHANQFLAAFVGGATIATIRPSASESFRHTGELLSELAKGGALLAFAALLEWHFVKAGGWVTPVFAALVIIVSRPIPVLLVLLGTPLSRRERLAVAWFGPKGFASVAYGVIVAVSGMAHSKEVFVLVTMTVLLSVVSHSSTDVVVAKWLAGPGEDAPGDEDANLEGPPEEKQAEVEDQRDDAEARSS